MSFRFTEVTSSQSLVRLPLCALIPALQDKSLQLLDNHFIELTHRYNSSGESVGLNAIFLRVRNEIDQYFNKNLSEGIEKAFNGYIEFIQDENKGYGYNMGDNFYIKLSSDHLDVLINIIKVYRAYAIQQFEIKKLVEKIRLLEFPETIYNKLRRHHDVVGSLLAAETTRLSLTSFDSVLKDIVSDKFVIDNEIVNSCKKQIQDDKDALERTFSSKLQLVEALLSSVHDAFSDIGTKIIKFDGEITHDLPQIRAEAKNRFYQIQADINALKKDKHLVSKDKISALRVRYAEEYQNYSNIQQNYQRRYDDLLREKQTYQDGYATVKAEKLRQALELLEIPDVRYSIDGMLVSIADEKSFSRYKRNADKFKELYQQIKKNEDELKSDIEDVDIFLKNSLQTRNGGVKESAFVMHWEKIINLFRAIPDKKIEVSNIGLDKELLAFCESICNIGFDCARNARGDDSLESEISCIQADAQRYVSQLTSAERFSSIMRTMLEEYDARVMEINQEIRQVITNLYRSAQLDMNSSIVLTKQKLRSKIAEIEQYQPEHPDFIRNKNDIQVIDVAQLRGIERQIQSLEKLAEKNDRENNMVLLPNRRPSKPGFFKRHLGFILGATAITGVLGLLGGGALAAGIILAPATFGLSLIPASAACIGIGVGVGIAAALGITLTGSVMACAACRVADSCCQPVQRQHQGETSLLGGSTAVVRSVVSAAAGDEAVKYLAAFADELGELPDGGDFVMDSAESVATAPSYQPNRLAF